MKQWRCLSLHVLDYFIFIFILFFCFWFSMTKNQRKWKGKKKKITRDKYSENVFILSVVVSSSKKNCLKHQIQFTIVSISLYMDIRFWAKWMSKHHKDKVKMRRHRIEMKKEKTNCIDYEKIKKKAFALQIFISFQEKTNKTNSKMVKMKVK